MAWNNLFDVKTQLKTMHGKTHVYYLGNNAMWYKEHIDYAKSIGDFLSRAHTHAEHNGFCRVPALHVEQKGNVALCRFYIYTDWRKKGKLTQFELQDHPKKKIDFIGEMTVADMRRYLTFAKKQQLADKKGEMFLSRWGTVEELESYFNSSEFVFRQERNWEKQS